MLPLQKGEVITWCIRNLTPPEVKYILTKVEKVAPPKKKSRAKRVFVFDTRTEIQKEFKCCESAADHLSVCMDTIYQHIKNEKPIKKQLVSYDKFH